MGGNQVGCGQGAPRAGGGELQGLEGRLERGEVIYYPTAPFPLPQGEDLGFLLRQELGRLHKNISYDPVTGKVGGFARQEVGQAERRERGGG